VLDDVPCNDDVVGLVAEPIALDRSFLKALEAVVVAGEGDACAAGSMPATS